MVSKIEFFVIKTKKREKALKNGKTCGRIVFVEDCDVSIFHKNFDVLKIIKS